jgi:hypothetical protein
MVYCAFFIVQFTSNFDISNSDPLKVHAFLHQDHKHSTPVITGRHGDHRPHVNIRLNKRFHPEAAPVCNNKITKAPSFYVVLKTTSLYINNCIPTSAVPVHLLRGPPVVA